jgi:hypothetical protein
MARVLGFSCTSFVACLLSGCGGAGNVTYYMTYNEVVFQGPTSETIEHMFTNEVDAVPDLFVKVPNGEVFALKNLRENVADKLPGVQHAKEGIVNVYRAGGTSLGFRNGALRQVMLGAGTLQIGTKAAGPFRGLPMTSKQVRDLFGEPQREGIAAKSKIKFN